MSLEISEITTEIFHVLKKHGLEDFLVYDIKKAELLNVDSLSINGLALQLNINEKLKERECQMKC